RRAEMAEKKVSDQVGRVQRSSTAAASGRVDMAQHFALADYAPKRRLRAGSPLARSVSAGERPNGRQIAASILFHLLVVFGLYLLPPSPPAEIVVPLVTLELREGGAAGSAGGSAGGAGGGGPGREASRAAS